MAIGSDAVTHYNKVQIILGIMMAMGAASIQFLSYKRGIISKYFKFLALTFLLAIVSSIAVGYAFEFPFLIDYNFGDKSMPFVSTYWLLLLTGFFALFSNIAYIFLVVKRKVWQWSGSISHIGFAIFILGILISQGRQETISINAMGISYGEGFEEEENQTNIFLPQGDTIVMKDYWVSYQGRHDEGKKEIFKVSYAKKDSLGKISEEFQLRPDAQISEGMGLVSNPDTKHYFTRDIFTHVTSIPEKPKDIETQMVEMQVGDTLFTTKHFSVLEKIVSNPEQNEFIFNDTLLGLGAQLTIFGFDDYKKSITPLYIININDGSVEMPNIVDYKSSLDFQVIGFKPETETLSLAVKDSNGAEDFIIMKAIVFPYINLLWIGGIVMLLGAFMSSIKRYFNK
jgi:cytochrome c-type biogenesis protein CcmF